MKTILCFVILGVVVVMLVALFAMLTERMTKPKRRKKDVQVSDNIDDIIKTINKR